MVFASIVTGDEKFATCQPDDDSFLNVTDERRLPREFQRAPTWVPVLPEPLKNLTPVTLPRTVEVNLSPTVTAAESLADAVAGCMVLVQNEVCAKVPAHTQSMRRISRWRCMIAFVPFSVRSTDDLLMSPVDYTGRHT